MHPEQVKGDFRAALQAIAKCSADASLDEIDDLTRRFRDAFLRFGSETPDNRSCMACVEVGKVDDGTSLHRKVTGLRIAPQDVPLSSVINVAEGCPIPDQVSADFPSLTQEEWDAALRMATMLMLAFEGDPTTTPD